jgi:UDP-N-acetylmuramate dehydrogenase
LNWQLTPGTFRTDVPLKDWCTLNIGGPARWFREAGSEGDAIEALRWAEDRQVPVLVLGGGSNVVIADDGFPGLVLKIAITGTEAIELGTNVRFAVGSGEEWDPFVARTVADNCAGLECLSGIPGLVGGTPVQNVGAYGQDVSATIRLVRAIDREAQRVISFANGDCGFGYRTSRFKHTDAGRFIVTGVEFVLTRDGRPTIAYADVIKYFEGAPLEPSLQAVRDAILEIRSRKGMVITPGNPANQSCGSFFVNPVISRRHFARVGDAPHYPAGEDRVKVPAAWLIEQAGFKKGHIAGPVGISPFQAQGVINRGGATAADVVRLAVDIKRAVWDSFEIALVPEPVFVGFDHDSSVRWLLDPSPERRA